MSDLLFCTSCGSDILPDELVSGTQFDHHEVSEGDEIVQCGAVVQARVVDTGDGVLIVSEDGEILDARRESAKPFHIHDRESAEWTMKLIFNADSEAAGKRARLAALVANAQAEIARLDSDAKALRYRFENELAEWASFELKGAKRRSIITAWGTLAFRRSTARWKIADDDLALLWAKQVQPQAVKVTEKVLISEVVTKGLDVDDAPAGLIFEPSVETFKVDSGVK